MTGRFESVDTERGAVGTVTYACFAEETPTWV